MKVYEATVIDKCASPSGEEPISYESHVAVGNDYEMRILGIKAQKYLPEPFTDEDIQYYFTEDEFEPEDGEIETEEFKYLIGKRVA